MTNKVLVVEDDGDLREVMLAVLRAEGLDVEGVDDARRARARLLDGSCGALLFDPGRPCCALSTLESMMDCASGTPMVLVSDCRKVQRRASELGLPLLGKPFEVSDLVDAVGRAGRVR